MKKIILLVSAAITAFIPFSAFAAITCKVNGQIVACPTWIVNSQPLLWVLVVAAALLSLVSMCKIFEKAGRHWWEALIPIYNLFIVLKICKLPLWLFILMFVPILNAVLAIFMCYSLAKVFGQGIVFTIGLILAPSIFHAILAFGDYKYDSDSSIKADNFSSVVSNWQHPELQTGEKFLGNYTKMDFENGIKWKTKRLGQVAYNNQGVKEINSDLFPVFVQQSELNQAGLFKI